MGEFIQNELLGMRWLGRLTGRLLESMGIDTSGIIGGAISFFIYDTLKILALLCLLIFVISFIQSYFPPRRTKTIISRFRGMRANALAALLGTVTPFCSCSSIPLFIGFTGAGLPLGVTFSFLISSPMVDLGSLVLLTGIFGWRVAAVYVLAGLVVAMAGGALIGSLGMEDQLEDVVRLADHVDIAESELTLTERIEYAAGQVYDTLKKVLPYVFLGVGVGAIIHNAIPESFVTRLLGGGNPLGVVLAALAGAPMYADIFGAIPVAEALLSKGALLGVVLAFMMGVTTLSLPSMIMLRRAVKPRLLAVFAAVCVTGIIIVGYVFNAVQALLI